MVSAIVNNIDTSTCLEQSEKSKKPLKYHNTFNGANTLRVSRWIFWTSDLVTDVNLWRMRYTH